MKRTITITGLVLVVSYLGLCYPSFHVETYRDQFVKAGELRSPLSSIAVHVTRPNYLTLFGKTYRGVQGVQPFYLEVPALDSVLFVTGEDDQTFHLVNLKTRKHLGVGGLKTSFGGHIPYDDFVESASANQVVVATRYQDAKKSFFLNFRSGKVERIVYEKYENQKTNRSVYIDGKRVN